MRYNLDLVHQFCQELGFRSGIQSQERLEIELSDGVVLFFQNAERDEDCLVAFEGTPWHTHEDFTFADRHGNYINMDYLDILTGLKDGQILICEQWQHGTLSDRWLIHRDYNNEFVYMEAGEEIRVWRVTVPAVMQLQRTETH